MTTTIGLEKKSLVQLTISQPMKMTEELKLNQLVMKRGGSVFKNEIFLSKDPFRNRKGD